MVFDIHRSIFPIFGGGQEGVKKVETQLFGSASFIGQSYFISTGHTITNAMSAGDCRIGIRSGNSNEIIIKEIKDFEVFDHIDLAIFKTSSVPNGLLPFPIMMQPLNMLDDVLSAGFPHGFDNQIGLLRPRSLKGYIVNQGPLFMLQNRPNGYELSFHCPKGISGAPLLIFNYPLETYISVGYIIGNSNTEMIVFTEKEILDDGRIKTFYEKTESTKYGIAIQANELKHLNSKFFGNIYTFLKKLGLLIEV